MRAGDRSDEGSQLLVITNTRHRVFQRSIIAGAEEFALSRGYRLGVLEAPRPVATDELLIRASESAAGVLLIADVLPDPAVERLDARGVVVTLVSHQVAGVDVPAIMHDNEQGMELLARECFDRCRRLTPLFVGGSLRQQDGVQRARAFRRELMARSLEVDEARFLQGEFEPEQAADELRRYLARGGKLDALVAADYLMAIACLPVLEAHGLAVPHDVVVLGFGDGPEAEQADLTTVAADVVELGRRGARQLVGQLEGLRITGLTLLSTTLIPRATSRT